MIQYGLTLLVVSQADPINDARLIGWQRQIGELKAGNCADMIAVAGNPLEDISVLPHVEFAMKGGIIQ
jgi:imidazolonepropionase-like amidohydrolase